MTIDRRDFLTGVALTAVAPTLSFLPASPPALAAEISHPVMMIEGWSVPDEINAAAAIWLRVDRSWRAVWR
jgi:hypothetical protein